MTRHREIAEMSGVELLAHYRDKRLSPVEATEDALARIERFNPQVNAYCHVDPQGALDAAKASEQRWFKGQPCGALDGVPASIKDLTLTRGMPTRKGSKTTSASGPGTSMRPSRPLCATPARCCWARPPPRSSAGKA